MRKRMAFVLMVGAINAVCPVPVGATSAVTHAELKDRVTSCSTDDCADELEPEDLAGPENPSTTRVQLAKQALAIALSSCLARYAHSCEIHPWLILAAAIPFGIYLEAQFYPIADDSSNE